MLSSHPIHMPQEPAWSDLQALLADQRVGKGKIKVSYKEYDWSLNTEDK